MALGALHASDRVRDLADVFGCGAAATADQRQSVFGDEARQRLGQFIWLQRIFGAVGTQHRQPRIGHHRHGCAGMLRQVAQVLAHLGGAGGAVQSDHVHAERLDRRQRRADLAAQQHGAGGFHRDVGDHRDVTAELGHRPVRSQHRGLQLQQVLAGLDEDRVRAAFEHAEGGLGVRVTDHRVLGVAQRRQLGARAHRAQHVPPAIRRAHLVSDPPRDRGTSLREITDPVGDVIVAEVRQVTAERVGLDRVGAGLEVGAVDGLDHIRAGVVEDLVAALEVVEVVEREIGRLQLSAHGAVAHHDPLRQGVEQIGVVRAIVHHSHIDRVVALCNWFFAQGAHPRKIGLCGDGAHGGHTGLTLA